MLSSILLEYVCPTLGAIMASIMFAGKCMLTKEGKQQLKPPSHRRCFANFLRNRTVFLILRSHIQSSREGSAQGTN
jgi:hypothetical protein